VCLGSVFSARQRSRGTARSVGACVVEKSRRSIIPRARVRRFADQTPRANKGSLPPPCPALFNQSVPRGSLGSLLSSRVGDATSYRERIAHPLALLVAGERRATLVAPVTHKLYLSRERALARSLARTKQARRGRARQQEGEDTSGSACPFAHRYTLLVRPLARSSSQLRHPPRHPASTIANRIENQTRDARGYYLSRLFARAAARGPPRTYLHGYRDSLAIPRGGGKERTRHRGRKSWGQRGIVVHTAVSLARQRERERERERGRDTRAGPSRTHG